MHICAQCFWLPKAGHTSDEYEDAFWPEQQVDQNVDQFQVAVADGATETSFSHYWARLLVHNYDPRFVSLNARGLLPLQRQWLEYVKDKPLPWYAEEKARSGAFSSLIGLTIRADQSHSGGKWKAIAVGDSCLFQIRDDRLLTSFPLDHFEQFNNRPSLLSSNPTGNTDLAQITAHKTSCWEYGDAFYLMTDALACWFLKACATDAKPWELIRDLDTPSQGTIFDGWITELREANALRNDDVTLFRVDVV
mgnify:CR=1 FL=1